MIAQARIEDLLYFVMAGEECRHRASILIVLQHAHFERLDAPQYQPALKWRHNRAHRFLDERKLLRLIVTGADDHATQAITVTVEKFCGRMHHHVGAKLDGA